MNTTTAGTRPRSNPAEDRRRHHGNRGSTPVQKTSADLLKSSRPVSRLLVSLRREKGHNHRAICCRLNATLSDTARSGQVRRCTDRGNTDPMKTCQTGNRARCKTAGRPTGAATRMGHFLHTYACSRVTRRDPDSWGGGTAPAPDPTPSEPSVPRAPETRDPEIRDGRRMGTPQPETLC